MDLMHLKKSGENTFLEKLASKLEVLLRFFLYVPEVKQRDGGKVGWVR